MRWRARPVAVLLVCGRGEVVRVGVRESRPMRPTPEHPPPARISGAPGCGSFHSGTLLRPWCEHQYPRHTEPRARLMPSWLACEGERTDAELKQYVEHMRMQHTVRACKPAQGTQVQDLQDCCMTNDKPGLHASGERWQTGAHVDRNIPKDEAQVCVPVVLCRVCFFTCIIISRQCTCARTPKWLVVR